MQHTIFYSWQSDIKPAACNRSLIENALSKAIAGLKGVEEPLLDVRLDHDTQGVAGSPDITSVILEKIDKCSVFVADVTPVDEGNDDRRFPNPNVLLELGYAIKSKSFSRVIMILNTHFGDVEQLPFDIRGKRILRYSSAPEDESRSEVMRSLSKTLLEALVIALQPDMDEVTVTPQEDEIDVEEFRRRAEKLATNTELSPVEIWDELLAIVNLLDRSKSLSDANYGKILDRALELASRRRTIEDGNLKKLAHMIIARQASSSTYFSLGLVTGRMGLPYDSIAAYMKAISHGDANPSLCYLNAGNRHRELNDTAIALSLYKKAVAINPAQQAAWWAAAQLELQENNTDGAIECFEGFLRWYDGLPQTAKESPTYAQRAEVARTQVLSLKAE
jgi:hypothetical protein